MMNNKTMAKAARELVPGEIFCLNSKRCVVVLFDRSARPTLHFALLGDSSALFEVVCGMDSQFEVELPAGLTPVQQAADKLLDMLRDTHAICKQKGWQHYGRMDIDALLDELDPSKPPTLEEAIGLLRKIEVADSGEAPKVFKDIRSLLKRVPD